MGYFVKILIISVVILNYAESRPAVEQTTKTGLAAWGLEAFDPIFQALNPGALIENLVKAQIAEYLTTTSAPARQIDEDEDDES